VRYRRFGTTGVRVSALGLGTMLFGGATDEDEAAAIVGACLEAGVNHFDTANVYEQGRSEEVLGRLLAPVRDDVLIASKVGFPTGPGRNEAGASPTHIRASVQASLRRLGTDRLDVLYLHRFDHRADLDHTLRALDRLVAAGDVLYLGVSNFAAWQIADALGRAALHGWAPLTVFQPMYNLLKRQVEVELLPMAEARGLAVVPYSPLAGGLLSGKYGRSPGAGDGRLTADARYVARYRDPGGWAAAAELGAIAGELGHHPATLAVAWVASHPAVTAPLVAGRTLEQLRPSLAAADLDLDADVRARLSALTPTPPLATDRAEEQS